jgi:GTP-binding protein
MRARVAIVGRPNVGKSTLFNRLAGRKLAIVHDRPGVTRDRREANADFGDLALTLIDTAGYETGDLDALETAMRAQTQAAIRDADFVLFVIDARAGVTPLDEAIADVVRGFDRPVVLAANKCEGKAGEDGVLEAWALGFGEPIPTSAEHNEGMSDLYRAFADIIEALPAHEDEDELADDEDGAEGDGPPPLRIAVVGRPNAGKSTLVNALLGEERLLTGPEPGVTRDAIAVRFDWDGAPTRMHDTAGLRKKAKVVDNLEQLSTADTIRAIKFAEVVLLVTDAETAFEKQDLQIADLVIREGRALVVVVTKWDLVKDRKETLADLKDRAERMPQQARGAPMVMLSGLTKRGLDALLPAVLKLRKDWSAKVKTRDLNDWLAEAVARHPPPAVRGKRIRPRYIAQTKSRPPTFVLMCSRASELPESYKRYLVNGIREAFELPGTPIRLIVKAGKNPYVEE